jgi:protease-4
MELERFFKRIAADPRPQGVILTLRGLALPLADLQTLRGSIERLRAAGKRVICFAQSYDNRTYFIASAADEIVLQPGGDLLTLGLRAEAVFLRAALEQIGVTVDNVAISPYKSALDTLTRSDPSPEGRAQLEWLLDSQYTLLVEGIAAGRRLSVEAVRALIDGAPYLDTDALAAGYVDAVETEEALHRRLNSQHIVTAAQARKMLLYPPRPRADRYVAVLRVAGLMIPGESGAPPVEVPLPLIGGERAGDLTVTRLVRGLMKDKRAAAVVLLVDSGGGSAAAAEAMTAALAELAAERPLVACFNRVAASGGYYIATPARWIVAQPGTITGSIGVFSAKAVTRGLWERLRVNRVAVTRGANAGFFDDDAPFTPEQRAWMLKNVRHIYDQFVGHVAAGRKLSAEAVDAVGGGRVWTGAQAKDHGLVDELGDIHTALAKARTLANLPDDAPAAIIGGRGTPLPPQLAANPAAAVAYVNENLRVLTGGAPLALLPFDWRV